MSREKPLGLVVMSEPRLEVREDLHVFLDRQFIVCGERIVAPKRAGDHVKREVRECLYRFARRYAEHFACIESLSPLVVSEAGLGRDYPCHGVFPFMRTS